MQACKQALKFCRKRRYAVSNVLDDLNVLDVGKKPGISERVLSNKELGELLQALDKKIFPPYYSALIRLLIVFGCRTGELRLSEIREWDFKEMLWTVPKEHSKTKVAIFRPIPESILPFVTQLVEQNRHTGLLLGELKQEASVSQYGRFTHKKIKPSSLVPARYTAHVYHDAERFRRGSAYCRATYRPPDAGDATSL